MPPRETQKDAFLSMGYFNFLEAKVAGKSKNVKKHTDI